METVRTSEQTPLHRLSGEDASIWLAGGFAALGAVMALAAAALSTQALPEAPLAPTTAVLDAAPAVAPQQPTVPALDKMAAAFSRPQPSPTQPMMAGAPPLASLQSSETEDSAPKRTEATPAPAEPAALAPTIPFVAPPVERAGAPVAPPVPAPTPAEAPTPTPPPCAPAASIPFERNSAKPILATAAADAAPLRDWLTRHPQAVLLVEGHTDSTGAEAYNVVLSFKRAQAVIAWLGGLGLPKDRMSPRAAGPELPRNGATVVASNRQVILQIEGVDICRERGAATNRP